MKKAAWRKKIIDSMQDAGTYAEYHEDVINVLADVLARRDDVLKQFKDEGSLYVITKTSDRGAKNSGKNPLLTIIQECERDALSYWQSLGMTPMSLKKIVKKEEEDGRVSKLAEALRAMHA